MKTTKFRILEFCYIVTAYTFITSVACDAFFAISPKTAPKGRFSNSLKFYASTASSANCEL